MNFESKPRHIELILALLTGAGHVILEVASDGLKGAADTLTRPQHFYNLGAVVVWGAYFAWRLARVPGTAAEWGIRRDGFVASLKASAWFALAALTVLTIYGGLRGRLPIPVTFWLVLALYPLWGIAQQFVLQSLVTRNLRAIIPGIWYRAAAASALFSVAHFPNFSLMGLTLAAGFAFSAIYERHRNIWAVGIIHGILGAVAYYLVIGQDPGAEIVGFLGRLHA